MPLTSAERQKRYRQARIHANNGEGEWRINTWVSSKAVLALKRLAAYNELTQREILEKLILEADEKTIKSFDQDDDAFKAYFDRRLLRNRKK